MIDRPILFSAPMVRALLAGTKTQTRRVLRAKPGMTFADATVDAGPGPGGIGRRLELPADKLKVPFAVGDRLWVRETFKPVHSADPSRGARYRADIDRDQTVWKPGIHMPRWASRLTLTVTDVRVQRLQDISVEDAKAEGIPEFAGDACRLGLIHDDPHAWHEWDNSSSVENYRSLWNHLNDARGFGWDANPWVVAVSFSVARRNIDAQ